jgi:hypothetical protein
MEPLLAWVLTMIEAVGPDIRDAWRTFRQLDDCAHPSQEAYAGLASARHAAAGANCPAIPVAGSTSGTYFA